MRRAMAIAAIAAAIAAGVLLTLHRGPRPSAPVAPYRLPAGAIVSTFGSPGDPERTLTVEAATDISFMRPIIEGFRRSRPDVAVVYADSLSTDLFRRAQRRCRDRTTTPDVYLTISTDHLVRLANDGCALPLPRGIAAGLPDWASWRNEVAAFSLEPAVIVYNRRVVRGGDVPTGHAALIELLRRGGDAWRGRIGTYDIEKSGSGYIYAELDSRQSPLYGRLIESLGRTRARLYCCSNDMVQAVARNDVGIAYNVQLSYAVAALRARAPIGIVLPDDYQAILTRSAMIPDGAQHASLADAFLRYLASAEGQAIARSRIGVPELSARLKAQLSDRVVAEAAVTPVLLRLQDQSRRSDLIREWREAVATAE